MKNQLLSLKKSGERFNQSHGDREKKLSSTAEISRAMGEVKTRNKALFKKAKPYSIGDVRIEELFNVSDQGDDMKSRSI